MVIGYESQIFDSCNSIVMKITLINWALTIKSALEMLWQTQHNSIFLPRSYEASCSTVILSWPYSEQLRLLKLAEHHQYVKNMKQD